MPLLASVSDWKGKRVLITGGLGFIGSNLAHRLAGLQAQVILLDHLLPQFGGNRANIVGLEDRVYVTVADMRNASQLRPLVEGVDVVFNLAGQSSHLDSMQDPLTDLEMNASSQLTLLECCRELNPTARIVFASTRQIYGKPEMLPVNESHPLRPVDINGIHKLAAEQYHLLYHQIYDLPTCALRLTNTYGPRMRIKDARQTFLGVWIKQALSGTPWEIWGGGQLRDFTYIDDAVEAFLLAASHPAAPGQIYNLCGCETLSLAEVAALLVGVNQGGTFEVKDFPLERKRIDIGNYVGDGSHIRDQLGWSPRIGISEGLTQTLDYFRTRLNDYL